MRPSIILILLQLGFIQVNGQISSTQIGLNLSNTIFKANTRNSEDFKTNGLLSSSAGILIRHNFNRKKRKGRRNYFNTANYGSLSLNYGINFLHAGYEYEFNDIKTFTNQGIIEFPVLLTIRFTNDFWMSRKLIRKGYGSYMNLGIKPSIIPIPSKTKEINKQEIKLQETYESSGFNFTPTFEYGIDRVHKNGNYSSIGLSFNFGLNTRTRLILDYEDKINQVFQNESFPFREIYFSLNLIHLINTSKIKLGKGVLPPIIYNPRYSKR